MYEVIVDAFREPDDKNHTYKKGEVFPRKGYAPDEDRIAYLLSKKTSFRQPVIKAVEPKKQDKQDKQEGRA